jgi:tRNA (guanine-N7-)-methyltransferase
LKRTFNRISGVGKNKIARWAELETFNNVFQPETGEVSGNDHRIKGNWNLDFFKNNNPVILELGCGKGEYTVGLAGLFPDSNFIGVDIKGARMWRGAKTASEKQFKNVAFLRTRIEFINSFFAADEVDEIWITFPDPHTGKKNSNKRLTCPWFLNIYRNFLKGKGIIHLKTDNTELYDYTRKLVTDNGLEILFATNDMHSMRLNDLVISGNLYPRNGQPGFKEHISDEILSIRTHYETKFLEKGMSINYLAFRLEKNKSICNECERTKKE